MNEDDLKAIIFNLENVLLGYQTADRELNEAALADLVREHGRSPVIQMALVAALTRDDADYRLVIVENTKKHPGGVPKVQTILAKVARAHAIRQFVERAEAEGGGTESAIAEACAHFGLSRSSVFDYLKRSRQILPSPAGSRESPDRIVH